MRSAKGEEATLIYHEGFLGRDYTEVTLKRNVSCQHTKVFWHAGPGWFDDPQIEWLNDRHLRIAYHTRANDPQHCVEMVGEIQINCAGSEWPKDVMK